MNWAQIKLAMFPIVGFIGIVALWQMYTDFFDVNTVVLPSPLDIYYSVGENYGLLFQQTWPTTKEILYGCGLAIILGIPIAVGIANSRILNLTFYPLLIAVQSVPKVALAPILLVWFGTGLESKLAIAFLVAVFPIIVDTSTGLKSTSRDLMDLARSLRATPYQTIIKVQFPYALPFVFSGTKIAVTLAVIGAVIGEFVGSTEGLGNLLLLATSQLETALAWAALIWLSVLGIILFLAVVVAERVFMPWAISNDGL